MTRRSFLQSVVAVPLVAVGMPRVTATVCPSQMPGFAWAQSLMESAPLVDRETGISIRFIRSWDGQRFVNRINSEYADSLPDPFKR